MMSDGNMPAQERPLEQFFRGLGVQRNVIGALLMRELHTRYGRENIGYLWLFLEPMTLAIAVSLMHVGQANHFASDIRPVPFTIIGYCTFIIFRGIFTRSEGALEANLPLLYHRNVTILDILCSRVLLEGAGVITCIAVLISLSTVIGFSDWPARPLTLLSGVMLMVWFSFGASMLCSAFTYENRLAARLVHPFTYILMPISGGFYQLSWIPEPYQTWLSYFPMTLIFEQVRYGQFRSAPDTFIDVPYVACWCMILTYLGLVSIRFVRRHIHLN